LNQDFKSYQDYQEYLLLAKQTLSHLIVQVFLLFVLQF